MYVPRENDINDVVFQTFSTTEERFGEMVTVELKPGGENIPVTNQNKKEYAAFVVPFILVCHTGSLHDRALAEYKISRRVHDQFEAFMSGFNDFISHEVINMFDEHDLEVRSSNILEVYATRCHLTPYILSYCSVGCLTLKCMG